MALNEAEELELLELERDRAYRGSIFAGEKMMEVNSRKPEFVSESPESAARMRYRPMTTRLVPATGPVDRAIYGAGGLTTDAASSLGLPAEVAAAAGYATNLGLQAAATFAGGGQASRVAPVLEGAARARMQSALKPTLPALKSGNAGRAIDTMLEGGYNATKGGVNAMREEIGLINNQIESAIANSSAVIDKNAVAARLQDVLNKFTMQVNPGADRASILKAWDEFINHPSFASTNQIPVQVAQELKRGTYRSLKSNYGKLGSAEVEAQKSLARGLKEEIASSVPGIEQLNRKESELINALEIANRRALMSGNNNLGGISWLAKNPAAWAAFMADKSPAFQSIVARMLYSGSEAIPVNAARTAIGGAAAVSGSPPNEYKSFLGTGINGR